MLAAPTRPARLPGLYAETRTPSAGLFSTAGAQAEVGALSLSTHLIVRLTRAECTSAPAVPVTVTLKVPWFTFLGGNSETVALTLLLPEPVSVAVFGETEQVE
jgi:hypothetical protein